jgi:ribose-phosphate pyrophosphokinase
MKDVVLLADSKSHSWDFARKIQRYIENDKGEMLPLYDISINFFNNKEIDVYVSENIRKKHVYFIHDSSKNPQEWWVELLLIKDLLLSASAESVSFVLPNMLYSRKDRKDKSRVPISARALANSISPGLKRIITMDLHASQIQGFYPANIPLDNLYSFPEVVKYLSRNHLQNVNNLVVVSPDAGGVERARSFLQRLEKLNLNTSQKREFSFAFLSKIRSGPGEIGTMHFVGDVKDKDVLIVDDIIDTGGTLCKAADVLRQNGAKKVFCYATHGIFTSGTRNLKEKFDALMTSNTHFREPNDIEVIDMTVPFAEAIYRAQKGLSISRMFD